MSAVLLAVVLLAAAVGGVYLLLKSMGQDGVEAAAPGSCKSGRCGVQPRQGGESAAAPVQEHYVRVDEITRRDARSENQTL